MNAKAMQPTTWPARRSARVLVCLLLLVVGLGNLVTPAPVTAQSAVVCDSKFGGAMAGYWRYDNGADPMQPTYGSLRGNIVGAVPLSSGKIGQALTFNGGAYVDYGTGLNIPAWDQYTVAIWFLNDGRLPPQIGYGQKIIDKTTMFSDFFLGVQNSPNPVRPPQLVFMYDRDFKNIQTSGYNYVDGLWHHAVILRNGLHGELWVDGVLIGAKEDVNPTINNQPLWMGYSSSPDGYQQQYWGGLLDEFAVFNRALTAEQIVDLYDRSAAGESYCDTDGALVVNSVADPGDGVCTGAECTLHEALAAANARSGADTITFDIPGAGPHTIKLNTPLPSIIDTVLLDGYSQPGAQPASSTDPAAMDAVILIEIDGSGLTPGQNVFGEGLRVDSVASVIQGLAINRFSGPGIIIYAGVGNLITGNFLGTDVSGTQALPNISGIEVNALASGSPNRLAGNLIGGNGSGIRIDQANYVLVEHNRIGLGLNGTPVGNTSAGIFMAESNAVTIEDNLIAHNHSGIVTSLAGPRLIANTIIANGVGVSYATNGDCLVEGNRVAGNQGDGMNLRCGSGSVMRHNQVTDNGGAGVAFSFRDGPYQVEGNTITGNGGSGVAVAGDRPSIMVALTADNVIADNGALGIDLNQDGVTRNDPGDADQGANGLQNFPVVNLVRVSNRTTVEGVFNSTPNTPFTLAFYANASCDPSQFGEGEQLLGTLAVTTDGSGNAVYRGTFPTATPYGAFVTALANGSRGASEFSACRVAGATLINRLLNAKKPTASYEPAPMPYAPAGVMRLTATFTNHSKTPLDQIYFRVATLSGGNLLLNADDGPGGVGAVLSLPTALAPKASATVLLLIGLQQRQPFLFFVDAYGLLPEEALPAELQAPGADAEVDWSVDVTAFGEPGSEALPNSVYLPFIQR